MRVGSVLAARGMHAAREDIVPEQGTEDIAAEALHERYLGDVFRYVARRVPRREEAEDITAEVFAAALTAWPRYRGRTASYPWLLGVARRKIADAYRRSGRGRWREVLAAEVSASEAVFSDEGAPPLAPVGAGPEAAAVAAERRQILRNLVATLNEDQREALLLHYAEELSIGQIAQVMGRSVAAVNSLLQRARRSLYQRGSAYFLPDASNPEGKR